MNPRRRRLLADHEAIRTEFAGHPFITVEALGAMPPEHYRVTYRVDGLRLEGDQPFVVSEHVVDVGLPLSYPRQPPYFTASTPVFHPNIESSYCLSDYWAAGQPLTDLIRKAGDMIQYRVYNTRSPRDPVAARWANENAGLLPIGHAELGSPDLEISLRARPDSPGPSRSGRLEIQL